MKRGRNELVGIQVECSKVVPFYTVTHLYRWKQNGKVAAHGSMRTFELKRYLPIGVVVLNLREVYASAIRSVWRRETLGCFTEYIQFEPGLTPENLRLEGAWEHWAEW